MERAAVAPEVAPGGGLLCSTCKHVLPRERFRAGDLRSWQTQCAACRAARQRAARRLVPRRYVDAAAAAHKQYGVRLRACEVMELMERLGHACALSGKRDGLVLVRVDDARPFGADNCVCVRRSIAARMGFVLPRVAVAEPAAEPDAAPGTPR